jgi:hypothetical protein
MRINKRQLPSRIVGEKAATISDFYNLETGGGTWAIDASGASATSGPSNILNHLVGGFNDQKVTAVIKTSTFAGSERLGVLVRFLTNKTGNATYYYLQNQAGTARIQKVVDGVFTTIASGTFALAPGAEYTFTLSAVGTSIVGRIDDLAGNAIDLSASDSAIAGPGICGARSGPTTATQISVKSIKTEQVFS